MSDYLRDDQYRDSSKLMARMGLHLKYGQAGVLAAFPGPVNIPSGSRVLEVGCGSGRLWQRAAERLPADLDIVLTDLSPGMVEEALGRVRAVGRWMAVRGETADVCALPFEDASFDVVLAMHMLYHAADPEAAIAEIARVLRPGGMAIASTNGITNMSALFELGHAAFGGDAADPGAADFSLESGAPMMRRCFAEVAVERSVDVMRITDPADLIAYLTSFPPGDSLDEQQRQRLNAKVREAFDAGEGAFSVTRDMGYIVGRSPTAPVADRS